MRPEVGEFFEVEYSASSITLVFSTTVKLVVRARDARANLQTDMRRLALLVGCAVAVSSCGGGGGSPTVVQPVSTFRANQPGDSWNYVVSINFGQFGSYTGTLSQSISNDTFNGSPSIKQTQVFDLALKTGPSSVTSYSEYSPTGVLLAETINAVLLTVATDTFNVSGTLSSTTNDSGVITFTSGLTIDDTYRVIGTGATSTPAGSFNCWIVDQSAVRSDGVSDEFETWVAPETGNFVKLRDTTNNGNGTGYTYTATLTSMVTSQSKSPHLASSKDMIAKAIRCLAGQVLPKH